jgi:hypothetical protein
MSVFDKFQKHMNEYEFNHKPRYDFDIPTLYKDYFFNVRPTTIELSNINTNACVNYFLNKNTIDIIDQSHTYLQTKKHKLKQNLSIYILADKTLVYFNYEKSTIDICFQHSRRKHYNSLSEIFLKHTIPKIQRLALSVLLHNGKYFDTKEFLLSKKTIQLEKNYNDDFIKIDIGLKKSLSEKESKGILLLHGAPGTGKTSYIRHLIKHVDKEVIFIPINIANNLTDPSFMEFLLEHKGSIIIIEDAENILVKSVSHRNSIVSALLNLTDGLLSDILNIQVICTFNTDISTIDDALLRKGRLIAKYEFKKLAAKKATELSIALKHNVIYNEAVAITDIYNHTEDTNYQQKKKGAIGG